MISSRSDSVYTGNENDYGTFGNHWATYGINVKAYNGAYIETFDALITMSNDEGECYIRYYNNGAETISTMAIEKVLSDTVTEL